MSYQLNQIVLQAYSKQFAEKYTKKFFASQARITGEQLLNFCAIKQVNLLMLKQLFEYWKKSIEDAKVPYFDYQHPEVQTASQNYSNLLSRHILIDEAPFYALLEKAVFQTLMLVFKPYELFIGEISKPQLPETTLSQLSDLKKYLYINKNLLSEFIQQLESQSIKSLPTRDMIGYFKVFYEKNQNLAEQPETYVQEFDKLLVCNMELFLLQFDDIQQDNSQKPIIPPISKIDEIANEEKKEEIATPTKPEPTEILETPKNQIVEPEFIETTEQKKETPYQDNSYYVDEPIAEIVSNDIPQETKQQAVVEQVIFEQPIVFEPVPEKTETAFPNSLSDKITFGQRFSFITQLFDGDSEAFDAFIAKIGGLSGLQEALLVVSNHYAIQYNWNMEKTIIEELKHLLENYFSQAR